ncbi:hypothetical protein [Paenibacillus sp. ISL-20]|uniref:hypothetical protein n=1 Tax=Paenibacillus sp. ISL-20 TaxID=2819163 RepID=UPI001BE86028|nr:hypothetical protein [Paenibacillus sp. ISL-20]MBT2759882.1 hypothetical protein [Paenibacillus sp. ISL-20]
MKHREVKGFDDITVKFDVSYEAVDGKSYRVNEVEAVNEYEAINKVAHEVNRNKNFGFNFKALFSGF